MKPQVRSLALVALLLTSCATDSYIIHPGSVSTLDSKSFDILLVAQAVIDQARVELAAGSLPDTLKPALNRLIDAYNVARTSWLIYRNAVKAGGAVNVRTMQGAMNILSAALNAFQGARPIQ